MPENEKGLSLPPQPQDQPITKQSSSRLYKHRGGSVLLPCRDTISTTLSPSALLPNWPAFLCELGAVCSAVFGGSRDYCQAHFSSPWLADELRYIF